MGTDVGGDLRPDGILSSLGGDFIPDGILSSFGRGDFIPPDPDGFLSSLGAEGEAGAATFFDADEDGLFSSFGGLPPNPNDGMLTGGIAGRYDEAREV